MHTEVDDAIKFDDPIVIINPAQITTEDEYEELAGTPTSQQSSLAQGNYNI